jgi:Tfp pilus assembly protein PilF
LFAATVKLDPQARYLRRAASCALTCGELRIAEEHAKKAVARDGADPSTARILARVFRQLGKLDEAEEVLVMALAMKNDSDALGAELVSELKGVRELLLQRLEG